VAVIYIGLLLVLRLFGKREVGQFTLFDLVFILLVANAVQPAMTGPDSSLLGGVIIIFSLVGLNFLVGRGQTLPFFKNVLAAQPAVIIRDGKYVPNAMNREGIDGGEAETAIREHGLDSVSDVQLGVLEPDGSISIVPTDAKMSRTKHRVRRRYKPGR
jgi:uncharacterized membrane protein YcaP (DUF421 family)